jgi:hypothetical protein
MPADLDAIRRRLEKVDREIEAVNHYREGFGVRMPDEFPEDIRALLALVERQAALLDEPPPSRCVCGNEPTCVGRYEGHGPIGVGCDGCCGHGNEDGWCLRLEEER